MRMIGSNQIEMIVQSVWWVASVAWKICFLFRICMYHLYIFSLISTKCWMIRRLDSNTNYGKFCFHFLSFATNKHLLTKRKRFDLLNDFWEQNLSTLRSHWARPNSFVSNTCSKWHFAWMRSSHELELKSKWHAMILKPGPISYSLQNLNRLFCISKQ